MIRVDPEHLRALFVESIKTELLKFKKIALRAVKSIGSFHLPVSFAYRNMTIYFVINYKFWLVLACMFSFIVLHQFIKPETFKQGMVYLQNQPIQKSSFESLIPFIGNHKEETSDMGRVDKEKFLREKQLLITEYLIDAKVARLDQLSDDTLLVINERVTELFIDLVFKRIDMPEHAYSYFTKNTDLNKVETSLMEQIKYGVPASIKLAQSAIETAYGKNVFHNNYFGIKKDGNRELHTVTTNEYYTPSEVARNKDKIITKEKLMVNDQVMYKCKIVDQFAGYVSPWESFRTHSIFLSTNKRYAPLFTKGKNYKAWADKIGSTKKGGVGYATAPNYSELLKQVIEKYHLHLLDY